LYINYRLGFITANTRHTILLVALYIIGLSSTISLATFWLLTNYYNVKTLEQFVLKTVVYVPIIFSGAKLIRGMSLRSQVLSVVLLTFFISSIMLFRLTHFLTQFLSSSIYVWMNMRIVSRLWEGRSTDDYVFGFIITFIFIFLFYLPLLSHTPKSLISKGFIFSP